jgi:exosortase D (VPLPA-CTERM-specific)
MSVKSLTRIPTPVIGVGLLVLALIAAAAFAFSGALSELSWRWWNEEEYSHGFLIPLVSAWLLWSRREVLLANIGRPSWTGPALIVLAILMHIIGEYTSIFILSHIAFILVLFGIALAAGGYTLLRVAFVPIAYLVFAIPVPYFIESNLTLQLQLISSQLGVEVIRLFQVPVYLSGNVIDLGYYQLQVVDACSGLRYLFPLLSLSFLAAYLFRAPLWQRVLVFLSGIPITIGMNGLRIGLVGVTVDRWGAKAADSVLHAFEGWVIFIACAAILLAEIFVLARLSGRGFFQTFHAPVPQKLALQKSTRSTPFALASALIVVCAGGLAVHSIAHRAEFVPQRTRFAAFPDTIGRWQGRPGLLDAATEKALGVDDYLLSDYSAANGKPVNFYVAYYSSQRNGYAPHSPVVCIPGGGWTITHLEPMTYRGPGGVFPLNRLIIHRGGAEQVVYYWFEERGRTVANEYWAKWYLLVDAITKNRTDGALIRVTTEVFPGETEQDADQRLRSFMNAALPKLDPYLPLQPGIQAKSVADNESGHG